MNKEKKTAIIEMSLERIAEQEYALIIERRVAEKVADEKKKEGIDKALEKLEMARDVYKAELETINKEA